METFPSAPPGFPPDSYRRIEFLGRETERQTEGRAAAPLLWECTSGFCHAEDTSTALNGAAAAGEALETFPWKSGTARRGEPPPSILRGPRPHPRLLGRDTQLSAVGRDEPRTACTRGPSALRRTDPLPLLYLFSQGGTENDS